MINYWAAHSPVCMFLRPGADCHAMGSWPKGCRVLYFYWQTRREFVRNVRARLGQDIPYPLSVLFSLFPVFFFLFFEDTKTELACVWVRFWSGRGPGHGIFFVVVPACVFCFHIVPLDIACGLLAVRANSSVQQSRTGNFVIQNTTDYRSFRLLTHTHTHAFR